MQLIQTRASSPFILYGQAVKLEAEEMHKEVDLQTDQWHLIKKRVMLNNDSERVFNGG